MSLKLVIPRDPLIFRDGKPFTAVPGEHSKSLLFPYPATLAGAVRTRDGTNSGTSEFQTSRIEDLKKLSVRGPVLVELDDTGKIITWFFPAPADALLVMEKDIPTRYSLAPLDVAEDRFSNLDHKLLLIGPAKPVKEKPLTRPPLYWKWEQVAAWLNKPVGEIDLDTLGIHGPERETRTHVSIDAGTQTALPGALFQTSGMEFVQLNRKTDMPPMLKNTRHLALALETTASFSNGVDFLGGERRVVRWEKVDDVNVTLPTCPQGIKDRIKKEGHFRLMLATPASFKDGYLPTELLSKYNLTVQAVASPRYQTISGWDYDQKAPKPTRRLVPAGSVYFLKFNDNNSIESFVDAVWLNSISDDEQSRADGFGLALLGTWDGQLLKMEVKHE